MAWGNVLPSCRISRRSNHRNNYRDSGFEVGGVGDGFGGRLGGRKARRLSLSLRALPGRASSGRAGVAYLPRVSRPLPPNDKGGRGRETL
jgi:hypothetical protein